jgi:hypothetical protein
MIDGWYRQYLGRPADQASINSYVAQMMSGTAPEQIQANLLGSAEYYQRNGSRAWPFVRALFRDVLGREPQRHEVEYWVQRVGQMNAYQYDRLNGGGRAGVALELIQSATQLQQPVPGGAYPGGYFDPYAVGYPRR